MEGMLRTNPLCSLLFASVFSTALFSGETPSTVVAAGYRMPTPVTVAPGQVITFFVHGICAGLMEPIRAQTNPLPTSLAGITVTLKQFNPDRPLPILAIEPVSPCADPAQTGCGAYAAITVQLPFEMQAEDPTNPRGVPVGSAQLVFSEQGAVASKIDLISVVDQVHLLRTCDILYAKRDGACRAVAAHADGSLVSAEHPARAGEEIVLYAFGLGSTMPNPMTGGAAAAPLPTLRSFTISFDPRQNALASRPQMGKPPTAAAAFIGLTPKYVGLYQINVIVPDLPSDALPCYPASRFNAIQIDSNLTINVGGPASFDGIGICVQPPEPSVTQP